MSKILVTGGAGYIGSHTCKALHANGFEPVVLDRLTTGFAHNVRWGPLYRGEMGDRDFTARVMEEVRPAAVIHFAANAYVGESMADPLLYFRNNVTHALTLLECAQQMGVKRFVFSSSCATYGNPVRIPIDEEHPQAPVNPYGETKLIFERALRWAGSQLGLKWLALRYFNAAGADPDGEIGEEHDPETHLIPLALQAALGKRGSLSVFGQDYDTPDGSAVRDYIHVTDLASAHVAGLRYLMDGGASRALNLGTGVGSSVLEVVAAVGKESGRPVPVSLEPRRAGDPAVLVADASRARSLLGWTPRHSNLETIVGTAWNWERSRA